MHLTALLHKYLTLYGYQTHPFPIKLSNQLNKKYLLMRHVIIHDILHLLK